MARNSDTNQTSASNIKLADRVAVRFSDLCSLFRELSDDKKFVNSLHRAGLLLRSSHYSDGTIFISAQSPVEQKGAHLAEELLGRFVGEREAVRAVYYPPRILSELNIIQPPAANDLTIVFLSPGRIEDPVNYREAMSLSSGTLIHELGGKRVFIGSTRTEAASITDAVHVSLPNCDRVLLHTLRSVILHILCEYVEKESFLPPENFAAEILRDAATVHENVTKDGTLLAATENIEQIIARVMAGNEWIFTAGNGGSACDAIEFVDLLREFDDFETIDKPYLRVFPFLDSSAMSCIANDWSFAHPFSRMIEAAPRDHGVIIGISTSGNSPNIIHACEEAAKRGVSSVVLSGKSGGTLRDIANHIIVIPSQKTERIQEAHLSFLGCLSDFIRNR